MSNSTVIRNLEGRAIPLAGNDIDTDRIIPARFLRAITFEGLGEQVFREERYNGEELITGHPFNDPRFAGGSILFVNANFGCGSSREHAPQALMRFGIRAIIGESFAEIFAGNCTNLGIPVFTTDHENVFGLMKHIEEKPQTTFFVNVETPSISYGGVSIELEMADSARAALLNGSWDTLNVLLANAEKIEDTYRKLPYLAF